MKAEGQILVFKIFVPCHFFSLLDCKDRDMMHWIGVIEPMILTYMPFPDQLAD